MPIFIYIYVTPEHAIYLVIHLMPITHLYSFNSNELISNTNARVY